MKINSKDFRVQAGEELSLSKRPTMVKPFCKSKKHYQKHLKQHVEELTSLQRLHYASNRYALMLVFQGMDAVRSSASNSRAPRNWNMTSFGAPPAICLNVDGSEFSIAPIMKKCWSSASTRIFYAVRGFQKSYATRKAFGQIATALS